MSSNLPFLFDFFYSTVSQGFLKRGNVIKLTNFYWLVHVNDKKYLQKSRVHRLKALVGVIHELPLLNSWRCLKVILMRSQKVPNNYQDSLRMVRELWQWGAYWGYFRHN
jgi:hypothetical protein